METDDAMEFRASKPDDPERSVMYIDVGSVPPAEALRKLKEAVDTDKWEITFHKSRWERFKAWLLTLDL